MRSPEQTGGLTDDRVYSCIRFDTKTYREHWEPGPWDVEPDEMTWGTSSGHLGYARRNGCGAWCGYVVIPRGHPDESTKMQNCITNYKAHGGITWVGSTQLDSESGKTMLGFDCSQTGDHSPGNLAAGRYQKMGVYRDLTYVVGEVESLSKQVALRGGSNAQAKPRVDPPG